MNISLKGFAYKKRPSVFVIQEDTESEDEVIPCNNDENKAIVLNDDTETEDEVEQVEDDEIVCNNDENKSIVLNDDTETEDEVEQVEDFKGNEKIACEPIDLIDIETENEEVNDDEESETPLKMRRKRRQIVIDSDSEGEDKEEEIVAPKSKRICIVDDDDDDDDDEDNDFEESLESTNDNDIIDDLIDAKVMSFLETCSIEDLISVPGLSQARGEKILELRPFANEQDLIDKINAMKGYRFHQFYQSCQQYLSELQRFEQLFLKCTKLSKKIEQETLLLSKESEHLFVQQPACVPTNLSLKHYQLVGLNWLAMLYEKNLSAILADQMGLGKTIQTLAFLGYLMENGQEGPHLIVCPCSTLDNWLREFETWLPNISFIVYSGNQDERRSLRRDILSNEEDYAVIITTFNLVLSSPKDRAFFKKIQFKYLILDEAHMMKNMRTERYKYMIQINAEQKLLLTGTPLQNDIIELMSLLNFLMPKMFSEHHEAIKRIFFNRNLSNDLESAFAKEYMSKVKKILKPFMLRRLKADVLADMPAKTEKVCYCQLNSRQRKLYESFVEEFSQKESNYGNNNAAGMALMTNLRKVTNHPLLIRDLYTYDKLQHMAKLYVGSPFHMDCDVSCVLEDMTVMSDYELHTLCRNEPALRDYKLTNDVLIDCGKLKYLEGLLDELKEKGSRVLLFSQFVIVLDVVENFLKIKNHSFVRFDGGTKGSERQGIIDKYNNNKEIFIFLLSTRSGGLGINLTSADTVILHDIDFNPYNDKQAEDRCHRVGQTKNVTVYKLIGKDTIEENMLRSGEKKLQLEKNLVGGQEDISEIDDSKDTSKNVLIALRKSLQDNKIVVDAS